MAARTRFTETVRWQRGKQATLSDVSKLFSLYKLNFHFTLVYQDLDILVYVSDTSRTMNKDVFS